MTKVYKKTVSDAPSATLSKMMLADAEKGTSKTIVDYAFWLEHDGATCDPWYLALQAIDSYGDKNPLIELLRRGPPPLSVCVHLADLLFRYELRPLKKRGRKHLPTYERSPAMTKMEGAVQNVRDRPRGVTVKAAVSEAARLWKLSEKTVAEAYNGNHGGFNRARRGTRPK